MILRPFDSHREPTLNLLSLTNSSVLSVKKDPVSFCTKLAGRQNLLSLMQSMDSSKLFVLLLLSSGFVSPRQNSISVSKT